MAQFVCWIANNCALFPINDCVCKVGLSTAIIPDHCHDLLTSILRLLIVLWNYLYLSQLLANCHDDKERNEMVDMIKEGSMINWEHINLHGEFDFKRQAVNDAPFDMGKILSLKLATA